MNYTNRYPSMKSRGARRTGASSTGSCCPVTWAGNAFSTLMSLMGSLRALELSQSQVRPRGNSGVQGLTR